MITKLDGLYSNIHRYEAGSFRSYKSNDAHNSVAVVGLMPNQDNDDDFWWCTTLDPSTGTEYVDLTSHQTEATAFTMGLEVTNPGQLSFYGRDLFGGTTLALVDSAGHILCRSSCHDGYTVRNYVPVQPGAHTLKIWGWAPNIFRALGIRILARVDTAFTAS